LIRDPKGKWQKKLNIFHFIERVPCPYCPPDSRTFPTNLSLARHVLQEHNWNKQKPKDSVTREQVLEIIKKCVGSKNSSYPDDSSTVKHFEELADEIMEAIS
jgi:uncharacterized C2H2 Zn-finger protein